jgi:hypothetical protein
MKSFTSKRKDYWVWAVNVSAVVSMKASAMAAPFS